MKTKRNQHRRKMVKVFDVPPFTLGHFLSIWPGGATLVNTAAKSQGRKAARAAERARRAAK